MLLCPAPRKVEVFDGELQEIRADVSIGRATGHAQGYVLNVSRGGIRIVGDDPAGAYYGRRTLLQLQDEFPDGIPCMRIEDWPDFPVRGVMLDISRDKVPTMQSLFDLVDLFSNLKLNQLQLYTEHAFAYAAHEVVWRDASPMTAGQIRDLDAYCRQRFIELVPNQNSFGHLERWLKHREYEHLAEKPDGFTFPWGNRMPTGFSLNPTDPRSLAFVESLYDELLPNFTSRLFNVGCDETFDIGLGRSKAAVELRGRERVYLDFILQIHRAITERGRRMMFWGDIILHKPELIPELPRDIIALDWGYEADHPFKVETQAFKAGNVPFYVCPGTSSWCSITGRSDNAIANLRAAAEHGLANGASGYLITDWGDHGHLQYLPISYPGFAAGAAYSWCLESNRGLSIARAIDRHIVHDQAGVTGCLIERLGQVYRAVQPMPNGTRLFWTLVHVDGRKRMDDAVSVDEYRDAGQRIDAAMATQDDARMDHPDADLILAELRNGAEMLRYACWCGLNERDSGFVHRARMSEALAAVEGEHRRLWLARNREGGLAQSLSRLQSSRRRPGHA